MVFGPRSSSALGKHTILAYPVNDTNAFVFWGRASIRWSNSSWMLPVARKALNLGSYCLSLLRNSKPGPPFVMSCDIWVSAGSVIRASLCWLLFRRQSQAPLWQAMQGSHTHHSDGEQTGFLYFFSAGLCLLSCCLLLLWWPSFCLFKVLIHSFFCFYFFCSCSVYFGGRERSLVIYQVWSGAPNSAPECWDLRCKPNAQVPLS